MKRLIKIAIVACGLAACAVSSAHDRKQTPCSANVLIEWNERVIAFAIDEDGLLTLKGVRTAAMMHVAMHDALNAIHRHYAPYALDEHAAGAEPVTAAAQAAFTIVAHEYPGRSEELKDALQRWVDESAVDDSRARAIELGAAAARAVQQRRANDRWDTQVEYRFQPPAPGIYEAFPEHSGTPSGFVFGAGWAQVEPFTLFQVDQFRVPPPPVILSRDYAVAFNEVKSVGRYRSATRTADQTHLALWWKDFAENSHNRLARALVADKGTDLWTAARMFALLNMSLFDGYIAAFDSKLAYNHWRPYTAIRKAADDGNSQTSADPQWTTAHRHTYPFPSYPSAHGTVCAAGMAVLADTFGGNRAFSMVTREVPSGGPQSPPLKLRPATRTFDNFAAAAMECALSRVYLGIHFRYDSLAGNRLGGQVAMHAIDRFLVPAN